MSNAYVTYVEDGESPPPGAVRLIGTFFQDQDIAEIYERWLANLADDDDRYRAHQPCLDSLVPLGYPCWDSLPATRREHYLVQAGRTLEISCTDNWDEVIEDMFEE